MFAVIKTGGKQYQVSEGTVLKIEKLEAESGDQINFDEVLMVNDGSKTKLGTPLVEGAVVNADVLEQMRDRKVIIFKKKRRQNYRRKKGHRQHLTVVRITGISLDGKSAPKKDAAKDSAKPAAKTTAAATKAEEAKASSPQAKSAAPKKVAEKKPATKKSETK